MSKVLTVPEPSVYRAPKVPCGTFKFPNTFPMHLTASTTIQPNSSTGVNAISLKNPSGQPMEILEIKFNLSNTSEGTLGDNLGGIIACKMDMGGFALTNGFVPVFLFGRAINLFGEEVNDSNLLVNNNEFTWRLPRPLYVPEDSALVPVFQHRGMINSDVGIRVSYSARSIEPGAAPPKKRAIPYAAFYAAKPFDFTAVGTDNSLETDLINPFEEPIIIQRFGGRLTNFRTVAQQVYETRTDELGDVLRTYLYNVRMVDSFGRNLIQNLIPFALAFSPVTRSWEVSNAIMDPKSFITAYIRKDLPFAGAAATYEGDYLTQAYISIVGHRVVVGGAP